MFNKTDLYYLPKLNCNIKFIEKSITNYSIDFYTFKIISGEHKNKQVMVLESEVKKND
jgi:hypothetical protein